MAFCGQGLGWFEGVEGKASACVAASSRCTVDYSGCGGRISRDVAGRLGARLPGKLADGAFEYFDLEARFTVDESSCRCCTGLKSKGCVQRCRPVLAGRAVVL